MRRGPSFVHMPSIDELHAAFLRSTGACTDTRKLLPGGMFFALKGPNFDANAFAAKALEAGCAFAVVDDPAAATDPRCLLVPDVLKALQQLALHHRRTFTIPVIGITGTNGKTTTKELVLAVLSADRSTLATEGNLNNHIGVPLTLLRLTREHRIAIIEMGANHVGDIAELVNIAEPTHGLITNIGRAHLEGFGSYEGVITAKTEMYTFLRAHAGTLFVNADDPLLMAKSEGSTRVTYGTGRIGGRAGARSGRRRLHGASPGRERMDASAQPITRLIGAYNLPNAAVAVAIGQHFGVPDDSMVCSPAGLHPLQQPLAVHGHRAQSACAGRLQREPQQHAGGAGELRGHAHGQAETGGAGRHEGTWSGKSRRSRGTGPAGAKARRGDLLRGARVHGAERHGHQRISGCGGCVGGPALGTRSAANCC